MVIKNLDKTRDNAAWKTPTWKMLFSQIKSLNFDLRHFSGHPWPSTAPRGHQKDAQCTHRARDKCQSRLCSLDVPPILFFKWTHCLVFHICAVLRVTQLEAEALEYISIVGIPFMAVTNISGLSERTSSNLDTRHMAQKHLRWNSDTVTFNKNTLRYFFSVLYTLRMSEHSRHYCTGMYKCNINVFMTFSLCTGSPMTCRHFSEVPDGNLLVMALRWVLPAPTTLLPQPEPGGSSLLLVAKEEQVDSAVSPLLEQN